jgi:hypothetical protein
MVHTWRSGEIECVQQARNSILSNQSQQEMLIFICQLPYSRLLLRNEGQHCRRSYLVTAPSLSEAPEECCATALFLLAARKRWSESRRVCCRQFVAIRLSGCHWCRRCAVNQFSARFPSARILSRSSKEVGWLVQRAQRSCFSSKDNANAAN